MKQYTNKLLPLFLLSMLTACQSTRNPEWYDQPQVNNTEYIYSVGEGRNLNQAKKSALNNINATLWTQVDSDFSMKDSNTNINDKSYTYGSVNNNVNAKTSSVTFSGVEYTNVDNQNDIYFAQARIKKDVIIKQLKSDISNVNKKSKMLLDELKHQDPLSWWLMNRETSSNLEYVNVRTAMLGAMSPKDDVSAPYVLELTKQVSKIKSQLLIKIQPSKYDRKSAQYLVDKLSAQGISTTFKNINSVTHTLRLTTELRQSVMMSAYISTKITSLQLLNEKGNVVASNEMISTGNSMSNYRISKEGADRHFSAQMDENGIWPSLGFNGS